MELEEADTVKVFLGDRVDPKNALLQRQGPQS